MTFKIFINNIRRYLMYNITKGIGSSYKEPQKGTLKPSNIKTVLIIRPNHRLGNQVLLTPIVQEVIETFPGCDIDLFVKGGVAFPVFKNYEQVKHIIPLPRKPFSHLIKYAKCWLSIKNKHYDLVINADKDSSSGRLLTQLSKAKLKIFGDVHEQIQETYPDYKHISKYPIYNLRYVLNKLGFPERTQALPILDIKLYKQEIDKGKNILNGIVKNTNKTICIYTNATGDKCYSETWWLTFYKRLLKEFPSYNIIEILPIENISKINFKAPNFYSKDIREMGGIIKNTSVFIAADNGVMHLASATHTPTVGFFSVSCSDIYAPYGNGSLALNTNKTTIEDWILAIKEILK